VEELIQYGIGRCHPLKGRRQGQYAMDLEQPHRLVFTVKHEVVQIARVEEIVKDYH
jgi:proteic killer suppression protein